MKRISPNIENGMCRGKGKLGDGVVEGVVEVPAGGRDFVVRKDGRVAEATGCSFLLWGREARIDKGLES
jgi:hypothetical protein